MHSVNQADSTAYMVFPMDSPTKNWQQKSKSQIS